MRRPAPLFVAYPPRFGPVPYDVYREDGEWTEDVLQPHRPYLILPWIILTRAVRRSHLISNRQWESRGSCPPKKGRRAAGKAHCFIGPASPVIRPWGTPRRALVPGPQPKRLFRRPGAGSVCVCSSCEGCHQRYSRKLVQWPRTARLVDLPVWRVRPQRYSSSLTARANLAGTFVNAFVNAARTLDKTTFLKRFENDPEYAGSLITMVRVLFAFLRVIQRFNPIVSSSNA